MRGLNAKLSEIYEAKLTAVVSFLMEAEKISFSPNSQKICEAMIDVLLEVQKKPEMRKQIIELLKK